MTRRRYILVLLIVVVVGCTLLWRPDRGPLYHGRRTADWVEEALNDNGRTEAFEAVLKIGPPAVPFVVRGLHDPSHKSHFLSPTQADNFTYHYPRIAKWTGIDGWRDVVQCAGKHYQAAWLLWCMGTNAQAAIPDVIDCLETCPNLHYGAESELYDTLLGISGTNPAAIPFLTKCARSPYSMPLRSAVLVYYVDGQKSLLVETCERLSRENTSELLDGPELFWFRNDPALNQHLVPLLEKLYLDPTLASRERASAFNELASRTNDPAVVLFCRRFPQKPAVSVTAH
jgi:hypothetical protein